ncbi:MAG TPA: hypothetical protein VJ203_10795 [Bacteroidales bacterium]|nr:hypothetical protein [Bacteroidales bacterium]
MKTNKIVLYCMGILILLTGALACNAEKEATERKNLMMPKTSEMQRNDRYKEVGKRKTNKVKPNKSKKRALF